MHETVYEKEKQSIRSISLSRCCWNTFRIKKHIVYPWVSSNLHVVCRKGAKAIGLLYAGNVCRDTTWLRSHTSHLDKTWSPDTEVRRSEDCRRGFFKLGVRGGDSVAMKTRMQRVKHSVGRATTVETLKKWAVQQTCTHVLCKQKLSVLETKQRWNARR